MEKNMKNLICILALLLSVQGARAQQQQAPVYFQAASAPVTVQAVQPVVVQPAPPPAQIVPVQNQQAMPVPVAQETLPAAPATASTQSPIYILNNQKYQGYQGTAQTTTQGVVQEQPTTVIEASPLKESKADQMRKSRQEMEGKTEQHIVEKLEEARIEDEKARADRLFGNNLGPAPTPAPTPVPQVVQIVTPPPATVPAAAVVAAPAEEPHPSIKENMKEVAKDLNQDESRAYISANAGIAEYPDVSNVRGNGAAGFTVGFVTDDHIVIEGGFLYSDFDVAPIYLTGGFPPFKDLREYDFDAALKYEFLTGRVRPVIGAVAEYSYRKYQDKMYYNVSSDSVSSNSVNLGALIGVDVQLTRRFAVGVDFRYLTNVYRRAGDGYDSSFIGPQVGTALESLDHYVATISAKFSF
jgi:hypothetical protein